MEATNVKKVSLKKLLRMVLDSIIVLGMVVLVVWGVLSSQNDITRCVAPDGFTNVANVMASDPGSGEVVYVVRGIVSTGSPIMGSKKIVIPACGSSDPSLTNVTNMYLRIDGKDTYLASGAIGYGSAPLASTQP